MVESPEASFLREQFMMITPDFILSRRAIECLANRNTAVEVNQNARFLVSSQIIYSGDIPVSVSPVSSYVVRAVMAAASSIEQSQK